MDIAAVMDAIANTIKEGGVMSRVYEWPAESVTVPCAVVGYPEDDIEFDMTFARGSDRAEFRLYLLVGKATDRTARDRLSALIAGARGIKAVIDGDLGGAVQTARMTTMKIEEVTIAGATVLAAVAKIEVYS